VVRGTFFETGFADFLAWRDWGFPDRSLVNCFAHVGSAGQRRRLLGVMSTFTANPGRIYFPARYARPRATSAATPSTSSAMCANSGSRQA
jgi:hypothetical protein